MESPCILAPCDEKFGAYMIASKREGLMMI